MGRFTDKIILVTGSSRGIGLSTAEAFAREGGVVIATDIEIEALDASAAPLIAEGLRIECAHQDVTDVAAWEKTVDGILERHGRLDVLVNNAGGGDFVGIEETTLEQWRRVMALNLDSVFHGVQAGIAAMKESGGAIVNVASIAANVGEPNLVAYCATKGGVAQLTRAAALDCAKRGHPIRINSIHPGYTATKLVEDALASLGNEAEAFAQGMLQVIPAGRLASPMEIAKPILFLASDDASYMIGSQLVVDGGYTAA